MFMTRLRPALLLALWLAIPAWAAPVESDSAVADPYELALRWTLAAYAVPGAGLQALVNPASPPQAASVTAVPATSVPDPGAYALMGLGLLAAGLAARYLSGRGQRPQRGLSKNT